MPKENILFVAKDKAGSLIYAHEVYEQRKTVADTGKPKQEKEEFFCSRCGCSVYLTHRGGTWFFAHKSTPEYKNSKCFQSRYHMRDIKKTNKRDLFDNILKKKPKSKGAKKKKGGKERKTGEQTRGCSNLKHIHDYRFDQSNTADLQMYRTLHLDEILITERGAAMFMPPHNASLGERILYLRPERALDGDGAMMFLMCWKVASYILEKKVFVLYAHEESAEEFAEIRNKIFDEDGNPIVDLVMVAAEWIAVEHDDCYSQCSWPSCERKSKWTCTGVQKGKLCKTGQVLIVQK